MIIYILCFLAGVIVGMFLMGLLAGANMNNIQQEAFDIGYEAGLNYVEQKEEIINGKK